ELISDYGTFTTQNGTATHNLTLYRASSGALVFGAGTVQWAWGLDDENPDGDAANVTQQQATVNLFADMGAQPQSLIPGLTSASQSADLTAPTSTITSPTQNSTVTDGNRITVTGTATDTGGGVVAGIEVSTDGGSTWHPASISGRADTSVSWSYSWVAHGAPT